MDDLVRSTIAFVEHHQAWGVPIVFALAFCESFAFVSCWFRRRQSCLASAV
jgi:hypothetical protein